MGLFVISNSPLRTSLCPCAPQSARAIRSLCKVGLLDFNRLHGSHRSVRLPMSSPAAEFAARITL